MDNLFDPNKVSHQCFLCGADILAKSLVGLKSYKYNKKTKKHYSEETCAYTCPNGHVEASWEINGVKETFYFEKLTDIEHSNLIWCTEKFLQNWQSKHLVKKQATQILKLIKAMEQARKATAKSKQVFK